MKLPRIEFGLIVFILILVLLGLLVVEMHSLEFLAISVAIVIMIIARKKIKAKNAKTRITIPPPGHDVVNAGRDAVWHEENKTIGVLSIPHTVAISSIVLRNCTVNTIDIQCATLEKLVIDNCAIGEFNGEYACFEGSCIIINSSFKDVFTMSEGGHNKEEARIEGNTFLCFANFFDEVFEARFVFRNNLLHKGSNLLALAETARTIKDMGEDPVIENNTGDLYAVYPVE